jgi:hypothetical protein
MASNSEARPMKVSSFWVVFQTDSLFLRKSCERESSFEASIEAGSRGDSPPAGEATVISVLEWRTW